MPGHPTLAAVPDRPQVPDRRRVLSPLRYPGGKRRMVPYLASVLAENDLEPDLFLEPYAGGASVALELVDLGLVKRVALADADPWIASFWQIVFQDADWLCRKVETIEISLDAWDRWKRTKAESRRWQALACLYLNRTSFNGALHRTAGPIGGRAQTSDYDLGCRFPRARLVKRIEACAQLFADGKIAWVDCIDARSAISKARTQVKRDGGDMFTYLDPPFWAKSAHLYRRSFVEADHRALASTLRYINEPWVLSYDLAPEVAELYDKHDARRANVELLYTAGTRSSYEELIVTNLDKLPTDTKLWRTNAEWSSRRRRIES